MNDAPFIAAMVGFVVGYGGGTALYWWWRNR